MYALLFDFKIGSIQFSVFSYAFCIVLGTFLAAIYSKYYIKKNLGFDLNNTYYYLIFLAGFVGGKILFWLENPVYYFENPAKLLQLSNGGFVFYGSLICGLGVSYLYLKPKNIDQKDFLDIMVLAIIIAHSLGRMGCFLGGCCYGIPTDGIFGVHFPNSESHQNFPIQLLESILLISLFIFLHFYKKKYSGQKLFFYIIGYSVIRFVLEFFRADSRGFVVPGILSHAQAISILLISTILFYNYSHKTSSKFKNLIQ